MWSRGCHASDYKVVYYESANYTTKVVDIYHNSPALEDELYSRCSGFYERGCVHILRQFHHLITNKALICRVFERSYAISEFKNDCNFVPFTESELAEIAAANQKARREWTPPASVHPDLAELCDQLRKEPEEFEAM